MAVDILQFILDMIVNVSSFEFLYAPVISMAALCFVVRILLRRFN